MKTKTNKTKELLVKLYHNLKIKDKELIQGFSLKQEELSLVIIINIGNKIKKEFCK